MRQSIIEALQKVYETKCNCDCGQSPCKSCGKDHHDVKESSDHEISMARGELEAIADKATQLSSTLQGKTDDDNLEAWVQSKITKAKDYVSSVADYLNHNPKMKQNEEFKVKFAMKPSEKIAVATYKSKEDAEKFKNDVISKGGKAILTNEELEEATYGWTLVSKAKDLAKKFANNYTKAVDEIEKLEKGLSKNSSVEKELLKYNESLEEKYTVVITKKDGTTMELGRYNTPAEAQRYVDQYGKGAKVKKEGLEETTAHVVRYLDPLNKKRFAVPFKTHKDAEDKMAQLKRDGVKDIKITMDILKPGIKFKEVKEELEEVSDKLKLKVLKRKIKTYKDKVFKKTMSTVKSPLFADKEIEEALEIKEFTTKQIKALQTAYGMLKGKTISPEKANALSKQLDKMDLMSLRQLVKANIPFVSTVARNKVYKKTGKFESVQKEFSKPRTLGKDGYGTAHPLHPSNKPSMIDKLKHMAKISSPIKYGKEEMEEGRKETIKSLYSRGKHSVKDIASRLKLSIDQVKGVLGEAVKKDKPDTSADAASVPVSTPAETKDASRVKQKEDEVERLRDQVTMLKNKLENEKNRAIKPQPNPETGEVPLQVGLAQKLLKDKEKKEVKEGVKQDKDIKDKEGTQPAKYYAKDSEGDGMSKSTKDKRHAHFKAKKDGPAPGDKDADTKPSVHTKKYKQMYGEENLNEKIEGLENKAEKSGMPYSILKQVYDRGMAAYKTGHRPGTTAQQWAFARVNSFITKSSGTWGKADKDLADKVRGSKSEQNEACWDTHKQVGTKMKGGKTVPNCVPKNETIRKYVESKLSRLNKEEK